MGIDGKGVTALVAGAGCPLRCQWCINKKLLKENKGVAVTAEELNEKVKCDDLYFRATGGGVTFGGGESLLHVDFYAHFREVCSPEWKLCAETSLAVPRENLEKAIKSIDEFIVDCKDMDPEIYHAYTGGDHSLMEENLCFLLAHADPERIVVRVPLIPEYNTEETRGRSVERLTEMGVQRLDLFSYVIKEKNNV